MLGFCSLVGLWYFGFSVLLRLGWLVGVVRVLLFCVCSFSGCGIVGNCVEFGAFFLILVC